MYKYELRGKDFSRNKERNWEKERARKRKGRKKKEAATKAINRPP